MAGKVWLIVNGLKRFAGSYRWSVLQEWNRSRMFDEYSRDVYRFFSFLFSTNDSFLCRNNITWRISDLHYMNVVLHFIIYFVEIKEKYYNNIIKIRKIINILLSLNLVQLNYKLNLQLKRMWHLITLFSRLFFIFYRKYDSWNSLKKTIYFRYRVISFLISRDLGRFVLEDKGGLKIYKLTF